MLNILICTDFEDESKVEKNLGTNWRGGTSFPGNDFSLSENLDLKTSVPPIRDKLWFLDLIALRINVNGEWFIAVVFLSVLNGLFKPSSVSLIPFNLVTENSLLTIKGKVLNFPPPLQNITSSPSWHRSSGCSIWTRREKKEMFLSRKYFVLL